MNIRMKWLPCCLPAQPRLPLVLRCNRALDWAAAGDAGSEAMLLLWLAFTIHAPAPICFALRPGGAAR
jgi:hypothetical protein